MLQPTDTTTALLARPLPAALPPPPLLLSRSALFLDFDGTLAPLAPRPHEVRLPDWVAPTLALLKQVLGDAVAVVSGRPLAQIDAFLHPLNLPAAGVHGVERRGADGRVRVHAGVPPPAVHEVAQALVERFPALLLESKPSALALHYRADPSLGPLCLRTLTAACASEPGWQVMSGHCVVEVKPARVSKGVVVDAFMAEAAFAGRTPVFVGDDVTDEDGMARAQAWGGIGVRVGGGDTAALHRLADPAAVGAWLRDSAEALARPAAAQEQA